VSRPIEPALALPVEGSAVVVTEPLRRGERASAAHELASGVFALVYRQMSSLVGADRADLDDLVQIAAEQALRALPGFEGRAALSTWTYRICYATLLKHYRWRARWKRRFHLTLDGDLPERPADGHGAADIIEAAERIQRLRAAVAALPPKRRAVVVLHDLEGLALTEVASIVGARMGTLKSRLRDGRRLLARLLATDPYFGDHACREATETEEDP
jgi:RNA polymerase sigma-70 factor, ECF subfamily